MHWTDRRAGKANLAHALRDLGWKLYGYHEDRSDSMTDYYDPASWDGVGTKGDATVVVDISGARARDISGKPEIIHVPRPGLPCTRCQESGADPDLAGWTLGTAQANPRAWHDAEEKVRREVLGDMAISLMRNVVSPLHFSERGAPNCVLCHGSGKTPNGVDEVEKFRWPVFSGNQPRRNWHVERAGKIVAQGIGLGACAASDPAGALALATKIDLAATAPDAPPRGAGAGGGAPVAGDGFRIEAHEHTKLGITMYLVIASSRLPDDEFRRLRAEAQASGGWYSRAWGRTPGGFAFKDQAAAVAFAGANFQGVPGPVVPGLGGGA